MAQMNSSASGFLAELTNRRVRLTHFQPESLRSEATYFTRSSAIASQRLAEEALTMPPIWLTEISSGVSAMDKLHHEVFEALDELSSRKDQEFGAGYSAFVTKMEHVFRQEELWMDEIDFPTSRVHLEQHARVLGALHNVHSRVMDGEFRLGRQVVDQLLPQWFAFHISTMDATLALAIQMTQAEAMQSSSSGVLPKACSTSP